MKWRAAAWAAAAIMAAAVSFSVLRIPIQVPDSLVVLLQVQAAPSAALTNFVNESGFLRPVYMAQSRVLLDAAGGQHYFLVFRGFHAALVVMLFVLFVLALPVRSRDEFAAFAFALLVLTGIHTFRGNVWESFPVNHYLEIAICCLGALLVSQSRGGWWADLFALLLFVTASLTIESGLLVFVVVLTARLVGLRGVSWWGIGLVTIALLAYGYIRFIHLSTGMPDLDEREVGFGLGRLQRGDIAARFGNAPYLLYAYNVIASILSVVASEPRGGTFEMTRGWLAGELPPAAVASLLSAITATGLLVWFAAARWRVWRTRRFERDDQILLIFAAVTAANAAICYAYTKDEIMSTAGVFYALAVFAAARAAIVRFAQIPRGALVSAAFAALLLVSSASWAIRATGLHYHLYYSAYYLRNEWVDVDQWLREQRVEVKTPEAARLVENLRVAAVDMPMLHPFFLPRWAERWLA